MSKQVIDGNTISPVEAEWIKKRLALSLVPFVKETDHDITRVQFLTVVRDRIGKELECANGP